VEAKLPTLSEIKKAIPERCFKVRPAGFHSLSRAQPPSLIPSLPRCVRDWQKSLPTSLYYAFRDFAILVALYWVYGAAEARGLPGLVVWWNLTGRWHPQIRIEMSASAGKMAPIYAFR
jgi:hypothetical protein